MAIEKVLTIFGGEATLIQGLPLVTGHQTASIICRDKSAWSEVFTYDPSSKIMQTDGDKLRAAVLSYGDGMSSTLNALIFVADLIIKVANFFTSMVRGFVGSFFGIGLMGIFIVFFLAMLSLMLSIYVLYMLAPLLLFSFIMRRIREKRLSGVEDQIRSTAFTLFEEACAAKAAPALQ